MVEIGLNSSFLCIVKNLRINTYKSNHTTGVYSSLGGCKKYPRD